jgi:CRP-like cAMP-binding protein
MSNNQEDTEFDAVISSYIFRSLDERGLDYLMQNAQTVSVEKDQVIMREGDLGDVFYLIQQGRVGIFTKSGGQTIQLAILSSGGCIGEVALLSGGPRTATAVALEPCTLVCFTKEQLEEILAEYPNVRQELEEIILDRANAAIRKITKCSGK